MNATEKTKEPSRLIHALTKCKLCRHVTGAVFLAILVIEAFILFFSVGNYERDRILEVEREGLAVARAWLQISGENPTDLMKMAPMIGDGSVLLSAEVRDMQGNEIAYLKQNSILAPAANDTFFVEWQADTLGYPYMVRAELDRSEIPGQVGDFIWRIIGLVLMISIFVTVFTMVILERLMLNPIRKLGSKMTDACIDLSRPSDYQVEGLRNDELGDVGKAYNDLLQRLSGAYCEIRIQQDNLIENNHELESKVSERTKELNKLVQDLRREAAKRESYEQALDASNGGLTSENLKTLAYMDTLTGLANRDLFMDRCNQVLRQLNVAKTEAAVHLVDLDQFNAINESFGQIGGDEVLQVIADRLKHMLDEADTIARLSGDQFIIIQMDGDDSDKAAVFAQNIIDAIEKPIPINDDQAEIHVSLGISMIPCKLGTVEAVLDHVDLALKTAKTKQNSSFHFYAEEMNTMAQERLSMERDLKQAVDQEQLTLYFQPKLDVKTGGISGMEALVRWVHPERGFVSPGEFIPVAERSMLIVDIGEWVLRQAVKQVRRLQALGLGDLKVAVNVSAVQLKEICMVTLVRQVLIETGLPPHLLELEITESAVMDDVEKTITVLENLRDLGVSLSIDDFGTGYSSLNYLKRFPVKRIKIDKAFVDEIKDKNSEGVIARAVITMGHSLGMEITAEGVEEQGQLEFLSIQDCDEIQGYLFGKPMDGDGLEDFVRTRSSAVIAAE